MQLIIMAGLQTCYSARYNLSSVSKEKFVKAFTNNSGTPTSTLTLAIFCAFTLASALIIANTKELLQ